MTTVITSTQTNTEYDYTPLIHRTDPHANPTEIITDLGDPATPVSAGCTFATTLSMIGRNWAQHSPNEATTLEMLRVASAFCDHATGHGYDAWDEVPEEIIDAFVLAPGKADIQACRLRKNAVHGAYLALISAGRMRGHSPAAGLNPDQDTVRTDERGKRLGNRKATKVRNSYDNRVHTRPATDDEILLTRLAARMITSSRATYLASAAVALATSSAAIGEAPAVLWDQLDLAAGHASFSGREGGTGRDEITIAPRTIALDAWALESLTRWHRECEMGGTRTRGAFSVIYGGKQAVDSTAAKSSASAQIKNALELADLEREEGVSAGSLRLWAAARVVTNFANLEHGAAIAGISPLTLHRHVTQQGERGLRRS